MRNREKLTEKLARAAETRPKAWQIFDTDVLGLSICIYPSGSRSFMFDYRTTGRQRRLTIGRWPEWSVTAARERAKALRRDVDGGLDPLAEREETREAPRFPDLVERYLREHAAHLAPRNAADQASMLTKLIGPHWKHRLVADIDAADVERVLNLIAQGRSRPAKKKPKTKRREPLKPPRPTPVRANRAGEMLRNAGAPFLNSHSSYRLADILGVVEDGSIRIEGGKSYARIRLSERDGVEDIWRDIKAGIIRNVSVGYRVHKFERVAKADRTDGGQRALYRAVDWEPLEISAVAIGADPGAGMRSEAGQADARRNSCTLITRAGTAAPAATTSPKGNTVADNPTPAGDDENRSAQTPAQTPAPAQTAPAAPDAEAIRTEERTRVSTIMTLCARHDLGTDLANDLIARGVSIDAAREAVLDALVDANPLGRTVELAPAQARGTGTAETAYRDAMSEALLHRAHPGAVQLSAGAREFRGLSLMEMARHSLERSGVRTGGMSKMELAGAAIGQRAGVGYHTTSDFPAILANVANKTLRDAYASTPRTFAAWARRATITDFKPVQRTQLGGAPDLQKVLESGEFQYGTIGEGKEVYALATYGRIIAITRQTLINDDLDAFTRIPAAFGASAADLESDIVYSILMQNPQMGDGTALFHADHGNLGDASVVSEAALAAAYRAFGQQKGVEDRLISILPRFILVPPGSRSVEARKQITSTTPSSTADVNTFSGRLEVVEEPRLIPSAGQDPWFLAADPARIDTVEYAYLDGQEGVFTETRMGFEVDGIEIKARHDFAAKAIDHRGLYRNPGAAA